MSNLLDRIAWTIRKNDRPRWFKRQNYEDSAKKMAEAIVREIETTHCILDPDNVTEEMLEACFCALPEHYDPPDMTRRPWHALKARRRFTAMVKTSKKVLDDDSK